MSVSDQLNATITLLQDALEDAQKVDSGKAGAPGTRLRKAAQEAKKNMDSIRKGVLAARG